MMAASNNLLPCRVCTSVLFINVYGFCKQMRDDFAICQESQRIRNLANGKPVVTLPYIVYTDDLSGNKTKKWNKFDVCCILLAGLSRKDNAQLHNIHFVCCSNQLSILEMSQPIASEMNQLEEKGVVVYDALLKKDVLVLAKPILFMCDNPRAAEVSNLLGSTAGY